MRIFRTLIIFMSIIQLSSVSFAESPCDEEVIDPALKGQFLDDTTPQVLVGDQLVVNLSRREEVSASEPASISSYSMAFGMARVFFILKLLPGQLPDNQTVALQPDQDYIFTVDSIKSDHIIIKSNSGKKYSLTAPYTVQGGRQRNIRMPFIRMAKGFARGIKIRRGGFTFNETNIITQRNNFCDEDLVHSLPIEKPLTAVEP